MDWRLMDHFKSMGARRAEESFRPQKNQIVLQNIAYLSKLMVFDVFTRQREVILAESYFNTDGWYLKGVRGYMMLFAREGRLYFGLNDKLLILDDTYVIEYKKKSILRSFSIKKGDQVLFSHKYFSIMLDIHRLFGIIEDPDAFDEEEFDFLLWVHNVVTDGDRRRLLFLKEEELAC
ncbi:MAG: hypothetical protein ACM3UZ_02010 [Acidobacteriota bacterium]